MADKRIDQLVAASTVNDNDLLVLQQGTSARKLTGKALGDYVYSAATGKIAEVQQAIEQSQDAINDLMAEKNAIAESVASMVELGTDSSLTTTGMAADAKATGDAVSNVVGLVDGLNGSKVDGGYVENGALYLTANGEIVAGPFEGMGGGGGGGGGNNAILSIQNTAGWLSKTISEGASCSLSFSWSSLEDNIPTGNGSLQVLVNNVSRIAKDVPQGETVLELGNYFVQGSNSIKVMITDVYGNMRLLNYTVSVVSVSISSSFDDSIPQTGSITYPYTPVGSVSKTVYFILDGNTIDTRVVTASGRQQTFVIPAQTHGGHTFRVYFECEIDGETVSSNELYYDIICIEDGVSEPVVVSDYDAATVEQYNTQKIPYRVYTPSYLESEVTYWVNGQQTGSALTVDRTEHIWTYMPDTVGDITLEIRSGTASKTIQLTVTESAVQIEAVTEDLALYLNSFGRSNNSSDRNIWISGFVNAEFSGFNWASDGWQQDTDGNTALRLSGDARVTIPYKIFAQDFRSTGKTIEIDFATRNVLNYDATILSCMSDGRGLSLSAQKAVFISEQSSVSTQYKEDEHVRLSFVVEKRTENRLLSCYINGILSGVVQYPDDDDFSQTNPVDISLGTNGCTLDIYCIRVYDNSLTRDQILTNWIADTQVIEDRLERYDRNNVIDEYGQIVINKLPLDLPYLILNASELPQYKGDKKTVSGSYTNPADPTKDFTFVNAQADVQGTSSQYYARKNYKIKFKSGFDQNGVTSKNYQMRSDSIPTNTFTFKADVASSEGANNVELARLYNDSCPYRTPPQNENPDIRQGIDGFPIVIFWYDGTNTTFIGKYNFNNDKGTEEIFGFEEGDESWEIRNNTSDRVVWKNADYSGVAWLNDFEGRYPDGNTDPTNLAALASWIMSTDQSTATGNALSEPVVLHHRTYDNEGNLVEQNVTYTSDTAAYRLDKFRNELSDHIVVDSALFYYLFTELFLMVDSRAKNAFPTMYQGDDGKWCFLPYDFDTAIGINNEGALAFGYELEDTDTTSGGANVYNGQNSVLWINIREGFYEELKTMYRSLRSEGTISYSNVEFMFENHQNKWPEAIFNEDAYFKYIEPLINSGDGSYLEMCQGSKAEQRKWWLYNRFRYIDSKYNAGDALTDYIDMRSYARSDVTITPYADIYPTMKFGSYFVSERGKRNVPTVISCPGTFTPNDTETQIYSASQLASVGDLSGLKLGRCDFHMATKLQFLKIGDGDANYSNGNLTSLTLGNNTLLKTLDVRNCPNLSQAVDISGCIGIEEVYFEGTSITGLSLPNGGHLRVLHLPDTMTNLTIRNQTAITDFSMPSYSNISTLRLENVNDVIPTIDILNSISPSSRIRLIGIDWELDDVADALSLYDLFDMMRGLDENGNNVNKAVVSGTITVPEITSSIYEEMLERQPNINIVYKYTVSSLFYYNYDGSQLLYTEIIAEGGNGVYTGRPSRTSTAQYDFNFVGWSFSKNSSTADANAQKSVTSDRRIYAAYTSTIRTYTVSFKVSSNTSATLQITYNVPYGGSVEYTGEIPVHPTEPDNYAFDGFVPTGQNITGTTNCIAQWRYIGIITRLYIMRRLTDIDNDGVEFVGNAAFFSDSHLKNVTLQNATGVGRSAFYNCTSLTSVSLPAATTIGSSAFDNCSNLVNLSLPAAVTIDQTAFSSCSKLISISIPAATSVGNSAFMLDSKLENIFAGSLSYAANSAFSQCNGLKNISLPALTSSGTYLFSNCKNLESVALPKLKTLSGYAFNNNPKLKVVTLPEVEKIEQLCFSGCTELTGVVLGNTNMIVTLSNLNAFNNAPNAIIYVPDSLIYSYKSANNWSSISDRIKRISELPE